MKILVVSYFILKNPGGVTSRVSGVLNALSQHCEVHFLPLEWEGYNDEHLAYFKQLCPNVKLITAEAMRIPTWPTSKPRTARWKRSFEYLTCLLSNQPPFGARWHPDYLSKVKEIVEGIHRENSYDLIQIENSRIAAWIDLFDVKTIFILDMIDVLTTQIWSIFKVSKSINAKVNILVEATKFWQYERKWSKKFDLCLVMSKEEEKRVRRIQPKCRTEIATNGVDGDFFAPPEISHKQYHLVFSGVMSFTPNVDAMLYFCDEVLPLIQQKLPQVTLDIVGAKPVDEICKLQIKNHNIRVTGAVEDIRPYLWDAAVILAPLRSGGGTRLKVLEALACGKPLVATTFACEGIDVTNEVNVILRDNPREMAEAIVKLLNNPTKREMLGKNARLLIEEKYDWKIIGKNLYLKYNQILESKTAII